jgi:hypothetical protein
MKDDEVKNILFLKILIKKVNILIKIIWLIFIDV